MSPEVEPGPEQQPLDLGDRQQVERVRKLVETLLFASDSPLPATRMAEIGETSADAVLTAVRELNRHYEETDRTFRIHRVAQGFQLYSLPEFSPWVRSLFRRQYVQRLSRPSLEVLAIIAYKQPVTRPEIESLRGVDCSGPLVTLIERRLIVTAGRAKRPGSPFLYRTTREFLRYFGLETLDQLPPIDELGAFLAGAEEREEEVEVERHETMAIGEKTDAQPSPDPGEPDSDPGPPDPDPAPSDG